MNSLRQLDAQNAHREALQARAAELRAETNRILDRLETLFDLDALDRPASKECSREWVARIRRDYFSALDESEPSGWQGHRVEA